MWSVFADIDNSWLTRSRGSLLMKELCLFLMHKANRSILENDPRRETRADAVWVRFLIRPFLLFLQQSIHGIPLVTVATANPETRPCPRCLTTKPAHCVSSQTRKSSNFGKYFEFWQFLTTINLNSNHSELVSPEPAAIVAHAVSHSSHAHQRISLPSKYLHSPPLLHIH